MQECKFAPKCLWKFPSSWNLHHVHSYRDTSFPEYLIPSSSSGYSDFLEDGGIRSFETFVSVYKLAWRHIAQDGNFQLITYSPAKVSRNLLLSPLPHLFAGRSIFSTPRVARSTHSNVIDRQVFSLAPRVLVKWEDYGLFTLQNTGLIRTFWSKALPPTSEWKDFFS